MKRCLTYFEVKEACGKAEKLAASGEHEKAVELYSMAEKYFEMKYQEGDLALLGLSIYHVLDPFEVREDVPIRGKAYSLMKLGNMKLNMGDEKEAKHFYEQAIRNFEKNTVRYPNDHYLAHIYLNLKNYEKALLHFKSYISLEEGFQLNQEAYLTDLCYKAFIHFSFDQDENHYQNALIDCDKIIKNKNPIFQCVAYVIKANILLIQENYEEAEIVFLKANNSTEANSSILKCLKHHNSNIFLPDDNTFRYLHQKFNRDIKKLLIERVESSIKDTQDNIESLKNESNESPLFKQWLAAGYNERLLAIRQ
ncbi:MAG: hypothetical protein ACYCQI_02305, partial [Gammaproteobacteria bacterium]